MGMYKDMGELAQCVKDEDLVVATLEDLRDALGYKRLGTRVLADINQALTAQGLGCFPADVLSPASLEPRAGDVVRVYALKSKLGSIISAVQDPSDEGDELLLEVAESDAGEAALILNDIRTLLGA